MTRHILRAEYTHKFDLDDYPDLLDLYAEGIWKIWQCQGCDTVLFEEVWEVKDYYDKWHHFSHTYPESTRSGFVEKKCYTRLPKELDALYEEIIAGYNAKCYLLCAVGLRTLIEGICIDKGIFEGPNADGKRVKTLDGKINAIKILVPENIVEHLHSFRFLGNDAAHERVVPSKEELALAIQIIEDILNVVYELDYKTGRLHRQVITRRSRPRIVSPSDGDLPF